MSSASGRDGRHAEAARVREVRTRAGLTQERFAARLGVSSTTVSRWENARSGMSAASRRRFAELERETSTAGHPAPGGPPVPISSLGPDERAVLSGLSVFAGPFTLPDAAAVTAVPADRLRHSLRCLVNSSWLVVRHDQDQSVYRMLDTPRGYAGEQLGAADGQAARARHGCHFASLALASEPSLAGPDRARWITTLERATADLEAALTWARETGEISVGLRMSTALCRWWLTTGRLAEGRRWLAVFTDGAAPSRDDATVARAWSAAALLAAENGDYRPAIEQAARALPVFASLGDLAAAAQAATVLGAAHRYLGEHAAGLRYLQLAVAHRRGLGDEAGVVAALNNVAMIAVDTGDFARAALAEIGQPGPTRPPDGAGPRAGQRNPPR